MRGSRNLFQAILKLSNHLKVTKTLAVSILLKLLMQTFGSRILNEVIWKACILWILYLCQKMFQYNYCIMQKHNKFNYYFMTCGTSHKLAFEWFCLCTKIDQLLSTMGEEDRGGLPNLDRKSRSGFFFHPDLDFASRSGSPDLLKVGMEKSG